MAQSCEVTVLLPTSQVTLYARLARLSREVGSENVAAYSRESYAGNRETSVETTLWKQPA